MEPNEQVAPESTAERTALWRALHLRVDGRPHVFEDEVGLKLLDPPKNWTERGDMHPVGTSGFRASIVARARFIEDLVAVEVDRGTPQYVILGAGLDSFAQRRPELASRLQVFEVDEPGPQAWKRRRLEELGYGIPEWLHFTSVDLESDTGWIDRLAEVGFDRSRTSIVASTGVTMYLTKEATRGLLGELASLAPGSTIAITFLLPLDLLDEEDRAGFEASQRGARASGTPFLSFYTPDEMMTMAGEAGFSRASHISGRRLGDRYFTGRADRLRPSSGEDFLVATV